MVNVDLKLSFTLKAGIKGIDYPHSSDLIFEEWPLQLLAHLVWLPKALSL